MNEEAAGYDNKKYKIIFIIINSIIIRKDNYVYGLEIQVRLSARLTFEKCSLAC